MILSTVLSGCAAFQYGVGTEPQQVVLGAMETVRGLQSVVRGAPGTFAMVSSGEQWILMGWPRGTQYAVTILRADGSQIDMNALKMMAERLSMSMKELETMGWRQIDAKELPATLIQALSAYSVELVMQGVQSLPTIFIIPAISLPGNNEVQS